MKTVSFACILLFSFSALLHSYTSDEQKIVNEFLDTAFNAYVDEDYKKAMLNFQRVLQMNPKDKVALRGLKQCKSRLRKKENYLAKGEQKKLKEAKKLIRREKWIDAIDILFGVLSRVPNQVEALELQNEIGISLKQKMSLIATSSVDRLIYQGVISYLNKQYAEAVKSWKDALVIAPDNVKLTVYVEKSEQLIRENARYDAVILGRSRAKSFFDSGKYEEAVDAWKRLLEFEPNDEEAQKELAKAQELMNSISMESMIGERYDKGLSLYLQGNFPESLKEWESILTINPENEVAKDYVKKIKAKMSISGGEVYKKIEKVESKKESGLGEKDKEKVVIISSSSTESVVKTEPAIKVEPTVESAAPSAKLEKTVVDSCEQGITLYKNGQYQESVEFFEKYLNKNPSDGKAKEWLEKVRKEQSDKAEKHYEDGILAYSEGNTNKAIEKWQRALKIFPNHAASQRSLIKVKGKMATDSGNK